jgi:cardiolipin synthase A/B
MTSTGGFAVQIFNPNLLRSLSSFGLADRLVIRWRRVLSRLLPLGGNSLGNDVTVYADGTEAFRQKWLAIDNAKELIHFETYTLETDFVGMTFMAKLKAAALRGVRVTLVYDYWGSTQLLGEEGTALLADLQRSGVTVIGFNSPVEWPWRWRRRTIDFLTRNHRKILVVDHKVGFCGGLNATGEYCDGRIGGTDRYRDTHIRIEGPAVDDLTE